MITADIVEGGLMIGALLCFVLGVVLARAVW